MNTATAHNPNPWVIVEGAGTDDESIVNDFPTFKQASKELSAQYYPDELDDKNVRIMRRLDDGTLTAEY